MSIALSVIIIVLLLLPFYVTVFVYNFGIYPKRKDSMSVTEWLLISSPASLFIHIVGLCTFLKNKVRFDVLLNLLGIGDDTSLKNVSNSDIELSVKWFVFYLTCVYIFCFAVGYFIRRLILVKKLHSKIEILRRYSHWWYLFNGYNLSDFGRKGEQEVFDVVFIDVAVDVNDGTIIYSGFLIDFVIIEDKLDRLYLKSAVKREFKRGFENENPPSSMKPIPGDIFIIPYENIVNMNVSFLLIEQSEQEIEDLPEHIEI